MKKRTKFMAGILCAAMLASPTVGIYADQTGDHREPVPGYAQTAPVPNFIQAEVTIQSIAEDGKSMLVKQADGQELQLNFGMETVLIDNETGLPMQIKDFKAGEKVVAYHSYAATFSIPPQSPCYAVVGNLKEDKAPALMIDVDQIVERSDDKVVVLGTNGDYQITVVKENPIMPYRTKNIVGLSDIQKGTRMFVWFDVVTLSLPAQATALRTVLLPSEEITEPANQEKNVTPKSMDLKVNGKTLDLQGGAAYTIDEIPMVPVREVAEALGFEVKWDRAEPNQITLDDGAAKMTLTLGEDSYQKASSKATGLTAPFQYGMAPTAYHGKTYVPAAMFTLLLSNENAVTVTDNTIEFHQ